MKKNFLFILSIIFCSAINAQQNTMITDFLNSSTFARIQNYAKQIGNVDEINSKVVFIDNDNNKPVINIVLLNKGKAVGILEAISIKNATKFVELPFQDQYFMQYNDYSSYDLINQSGSIKTFDLNYECYLSSHIVVNNDKITNFSSYGIPVEIAKKHPMDTNGNGNVSFGECMGYAQNACNGSSTCATLCTLTNVGGIGTSIGGQCTISMAAACLYIAVKY